jgi:hypothetical protein
VENEPALDPIHTESAFSCAQRQFRALATNTVRFVLWFFGCNLAVVATTTYLAWGHSRTAQVAIGVGAFVAGAALAFLLPLGALWVTAPIRQRDDARAAIARLATPPGFPDVEINLPDLTQTPRSDGDGVDVRLPIFATNRTDGTAILEFNLALQMPEGRPPARVRAFRDHDLSLGLHPALTIPPRTDGNATLYFPVLGSNLAQMREAGHDQPGYAPVHLLSLLVSERLSNTMRSMGIPTSPSW